MKTKILEIRDEGTMIPVLCIDMNPTQWEIADGAARQNPDKYLVQRWYMHERCGFPCDGRPNIMMTHLGLDGGPATNDPIAWGGRTRPVAHAYIIENWPKLSDGDVIDVEYILGERATPKISERVAR